MNRTDHRKYVILVLFILVPVVFVIKLFYMQVIDDKWKKRAVQISGNKVVVYPSRGIVYDRNKTELISNEVHYDIHVVPKQAKQVDSVSLAQLLGISLASYTNKMNKAKAYSMRKPSELVKQISPEEFADIAPELYKYPGFYEVERTLRAYPQSTAAHILGYMAEVDSVDIKRDAYYVSGDAIGKSGVEKSYETLLRGQKGVRYYLQDAIGIKTGRYKNGQYDLMAQRGRNIQLTIDATLQAYGEQLMQNKRGSIVAIEPSSGEILSMVSSPSYDPNLLVGRRLAANYSQLMKDTLLPLQNRATNSTYPPGSTFKLLMALIALQEGVITENARFPCSKNLVGCHNHAPVRSVSDGIKMSCNPYFYYVTRRIIQQGKDDNHFRDAAIGLDIWADYLKRFGLGVDAEVDFPAVRHGFIPNAHFYNHAFPSSNHPYGVNGWAFSTIYSNSIGQGEVLVSPLEMANIGCIMANRGWFYPPHFIKQIENAAIPKNYTTKRYTKVDAEYFEPVIDGMWRVVHESGGTARRARVDSLSICGKTGTVENFGSYNGKRRQLIDHSIFIAFAPRDNPQIAVSVYIENAGFGGTWAAPLASLLIEKYVTGEVKDHLKEKRILEADLTPTRFAKKKW